MRALVQRVKEAKVEVEGKTVGAIHTGVLVFLGIHQKDQEAEAVWLAKKVATLRMFRDEGGKMNLSLQDVKGQLLVVSQFTLYGNCSNGRRPDFIEAMNGPEAEGLYLKFVEESRRWVDRVETGQFGASMQVSLTNDGPVTFLIE